VKKTGQALLYPAAWVLGWFASRFADSMSAALDQLEFELGFDEPIPDSLKVLKPTSEVVEPWHGKVKSGG
jgi:hypothetical protein